jgi:hypothetical protein
VASGQLAGARAARRRTRARSAASAARTAGRQRRPGGWSRRAMRKRRAGAPSARRPTRARGRQPTSGTQTLGPCPGSRSIDLPLDLPMRVPQAQRGSGAGVLCAGRGPGGSARPAGSSGRATACQGRTASGRAGASRLGGARARIGRGGRAARRWRGSHALPRGRCAGCAKAVQGATSFVGGGCEGCHRSAAFGLDGEGTKRWCADCAKGHEGAILFDPRWLFCATLVRSRRSRLLRLDGLNRTKPSELLAWSELGAAGAARTAAPSRRGTGYPWTAGGVGARTVRGRTWTRSAALPRCPQGSGAPDMNAPSVCAHLLRGRCCRELRAPPQGAVDVAKRPAAKCEACGEHGRTPLYGLASERPTDGSAVSKGRCPPRWCDQGSVAVSLQSQRHRISASVRYKADPWWFKSGNATGP